MELDILQVLKNLSKYQEETRKWRDKTVIDKFISVGDWVLKRKPNAKTSANYSPNGTGPTWSYTPTG